MNDYLRWYLYFRYWLRGRQLLKQRRKLGAFEQHD